MTFRRSTSLTLTALFLMAGCVPTQGNDPDPDSGVIVVDEDAGGGEEDTGGGDEDAGGGEGDAGSGEEDAAVDADDPSDPLEVGKACSSDDECPGGGCFEDVLPGGYCTRSCSEATPCPNGASCFDEVCFADCSNDAECRAEYQCTDEGVCVPRPVEIDVPVGDACAADGDCGDDGVCLTDFPGGYCTGGCDALNLCPEDALCLDLENGNLVCVKACTSDSQCRDGYLCSPGDLCIPEPTAEDVFQSFALFNPCQGGVWGSWTNGEDFAINEIQILDDAGQLLSTRTFFDPLRFTGGTEDDYELFEDIDLTAGTNATVRFKLTSGEIYELEAQVSDDLPPSNNLLEVRSVDVVGGELEVTLRPSFQGSIQRATVYDTSGCLQTRSTLLSPVPLSNGASTTVEISSTFPAATDYEIVLEGRNTDINYSFYDVIPFTTP